MNNNKKNHIKAVLCRFRCSRAQIFESITTDLGVNSIDSIINMYNTIIKDIKKRLAILVDFIVNETT